MKILIAEDDPVLTQLLRKKLELWGHEVAVARDGREAWDVLQSEDVNCLIADWMMPVMDGIELCQKVRSSQRSRYLYIILLTAKDGQDDSVRGLEAGADDYIKKPFFQWEELKARIRAGERIINLLDEIKTLNRILPICFSCKKIRDDAGYWNELESYISEHSGAEFSHGLCPACFKKLYPEYYSEQ